MGNILPGNHEPPVHYPSHPRVVHTPQIQIQRISPHPYEPQVPTPYISRHYPHYDDFYVENEPQEYQREHEDTSTVTSPIIEHPNPARMNMGGSFWKIMSNDVDEFINDIQTGKMTMDELPERVTAHFSRVDNMPELWRLRINFGRGCKLTREMREEILLEIELGMERACILTWDLKNAGESSTSNGSKPVKIDVRRSSQVRSRALYELTILEDDENQRQALKNSTRIFCRRWRAFAREEKIQHYLDTNESECLNKKILQILGGEIPNTPLRFTGNSNDGEALDQLLHLPSYLNKGQRRALNHKNFHKLQLIHGPPGTGKTTVISTCVDVMRQFFAAKARNNSRHIVIVTSEKNSAIDDVAAALLRQFSSNSGCPLLEQTLSFGSYAMGLNTEKFELETKVEEHPDIKPFYNRIEALEKQNNDSKESSMKKMEEIQKSTKNKKKKKEKKKEKKNEKKNNNKIQGEITREKGNLKKMSARIRSDYIQSCKAVLVTLGSLNQMVRKLFGPSETDGENQTGELSFTVVIDEASTLMSYHFASILKVADLANAKISNVLVVGDDKQLGPYWPTLHSDPDLSDCYWDTKTLSFFDYVNKIVSKPEGQAAKRALQAQYRMPRCTMDLMNAHFYDKTPMIYSKSESLAARDLGEILWFESKGLVRSSDPASKEIRRNVNVSECNLIINVVVPTLLKVASKPSIMIITPYKNQYECLEHELLAYMDKNPEASEYGSVTVSTIDGSQGSEADFVIVSLVRKNPSPYLNARRCCVMISRARHLVTFVGERQSTLKSHNPFLRHVARESAPIQPPKQTN